MQVWVISQGETLPIQPGTRRMRAGMLASALVRRGHRVTWWSSTFSHQHKVLLYDRDTEIDVEPGLRLQLIHSGAYRRNISFRRYRHLRSLACRFSRQAADMFPPDVVITAFPAIDLAYEAVRYARIREIPVIVDIRDLWPDTFVAKTHKALQCIARVLLQRDFHRTRVLLRDANSLVSISSGCLDWGLSYAGRSRTANDKVVYTSYLPENRSDHKVSERIEKITRTTQGKVVFTFVGSFGHSYELSLICTVARELAHSGVDKIHFVLAGDGLQFNTVAQAAWSLSNLTLTGWLDQPDLQYLLKCSDVGLVPCRSVRDAMPNKPFEYWAAGLPIVSSLEGEMEAIIATHHVGLSYRCGDAAMLHKNIVTLAQDHALRETQSTNARKLFVEHFSPALVYQSYADHVENIAI